MFVLEREQLVRRSIDDVFRFFGDPRNLEEITPPWLRFRVLKSSTPEIQEGTSIDYGLRVRGVPLRWRSLIRTWRPPYEFVDEQVRGPYRTWIHRHTFEEVEGGVLVGDRVEYEVPGGWLVDRLFVRRDLARVFDFRKRHLERLLA